MVYRSKADNEDNNKDTSSREKEDKRTSTSNEDMRPHHSGTTVNTPPRTADPPGTNKEDFGLLTQLLEPKNLEDQQPQVDPLRTLSKPFLRKPPCLTGQGSTLSLYQMQGIEIESQTS